MIHNVAMRDTDKTMMLKHCLQGKAAKWANKVGVEFHSYEALIVTLEKMYGGVQKSFNMVTRKIMHFKWSGEYTSLSEFNQLLEDAAIISEARGNEPAMSSSTFYSLVSMCLPAGIDKQFMEAMTVEKIPDEDIRVSHLSNWLDQRARLAKNENNNCLLYTSDAADE